LKKRLWESRSTPTLAGSHVSRQISFKISGVEKRLWKSRSTPTLVTNDNKAYFL
jgi:hypothetical protein